MTSRTGHFTRIRASQMAWKRRATLSQTEQLTNLPKGRSWSLSDKWRHRYKPDKRAYASWSKIWNEDRALPVLTSGIASQWGVFHQLSAKRSKNAKITQNLDKLSSVLKQLLTKRLTQSTHTWQKRSDPTSLIPHLWQVRITAMSWPSRRWRNTTRSLSRRRASSSNAFLILSRILRDKARWYQCSLLKAC